MKTNSFRKINFEVSRGNGYGQYVINATYKGKLISTHTTDSEIWDWIDDDSNKEKYNDARRHCYREIVEEYNRLYN
ncbi:MAG: hypothetical protein LIP08_02975 [Bacteroides sp.]|nr:hypothetical protein [Bacteroides sp.]